jgi:hypothetical protein
LGRRNIQRPVAIIGRAEVADKDKDSAREGGRETETEDANQTATWLEVSNNLIQGVTQLLGAIS